MPTQEEKPINKLGILAGGGRLPRLLVEACHAQGITPFVVAFQGHAEDEATRGVEHIRVRLGAAGTVLKTLKSHGITDIVMIGSIRRPSLKELRPDMRTLKFYSKLGLKALGDSDFLDALKREFEGEGFTVHAAQEFMDSMLSKPGVMGKHKPDATQSEDIRRGAEAALALGLMDVGQAAVAQEGIVLGVEGAEGTDDLIRRCISLKRKGSGPVLVKACKPQQDKALDLPTIGPETVRLAAEGGFSGIAVQAGASFVVDADECIRLADAAGLFLTAIEMGEAA